LKRSADQIFLVLVFYIFLIIIVIASPLLTLLTTSEVALIACTYSLVILSSLLFVRFMGLRISKGGFLTGSIAAIASMALIFVVFLAAGIVSAVSLRDNFVTILLAGAVIQLFVAFGEELSFRAAIFRGLDINIGFWPAALISASAFALLHIPSMFTLGIEPVTAIVGLCTIIIAGIVLAMLYKYGGLFNAIAFHFFWNFMEYHLFTLGSLEGALNVTESGPALLTGGGFGPEASIVALPVVAAMAIALWYYYKKKGLIRTETVIS
jgi:membrane protease YdiL (CAAX protease family)